jgi:hypothetical protein
MGAMLFGGFAAGKTNPRQKSFDISILNSVLPPMDRIESSTISLKLPAARYIASVFSIGVPTWIA